MKQTYQVLGMTCSNCKASVFNKLQGIEGVSNVAVDLERAEAVIESAEEIPLASVQEALPNKYTVSYKNAKVAPVITEQASDLKQLYPLFLIFGYLFVSAFLLNRNPWNLQAFMLDFMGLFYIVFSFFKFLDLKGFPESFKMYDPLAKVLPIYGWIYPFIELALGLMFLMRLQIEVALLITILILGLTTLGVTKVLLDKKSIQCACL